MTYSYLVGVDEAGRGPIAGPVAVGVYALPYSAPFTRKRNFRDSKKRTEKDRESMFEELTGHPDAVWAVALIGAKQVDAVGIAAAIRTALQRALRRAKINPSTSYVLLDGGLHAPEIFKHQATIIKGDEKKSVIAAASILAKVTRDRHMHTLHKRLPMYGFDVHKGYGTSTHYKNIRQYGLSDAHRVTFCTKLLQ